MREDNNLKGNVDAEEPAYHLVGPNAKDQRGRLCVHQAGSTLPPPQALGGAVVRRTLPRRVARKMRSSSPHRPSALERALKQEWLNPSKQYRFEQFLLMSVPNLTLNRHGLKTFTELSRTTPLSWTSTRRTSWR